MKLFGKWHRRLDKVEFFKFRPIRRFHRELVSPWDDNGYIVGYKKIYWSEARKGSGSYALAEYHHYLHINLFFVFLRFKWRSR